MNLIVGATGILGGMISRRLLEMGEPVRAFVRKESDYQPLQEAGAEVAIGDLRDSESLAKACRGARRVITTATAPLPVRHTKEECDAIDWRGTQSLIDAARSASVEQFVYTSFLGASPDAPYPLAYAKGKNEIYLQESGLNYTIIQPVMFMEVWIGFVLGAQLQHGPSVTIVGEGSNKLGFVSDRNVCDLMVAVLGHETAQNAVIPINGPASYSFREIINMIEGVSDKSIEVKSVPAGGVISGMPQLVNDLWAIFASTGDMIVDTSEVARTYGLELVTVQDYLKGAFAPSAT